MNFLKTLKYPQTVFIFVLFLLFVFMAPFTVQTGDTGELVTNSYFLRVAHPPGYPLWTILYHLPIRYLRILTPFYSASLLTAMISCLWIGILAFRFRNKASLAVIMVLSTSVIFWRYSILPDVFSLHMFFLVLVFLAFMQPDLLDKKWIIFLISLSVTNHHTIVFAFPLYLYAVLKGDSRKKILPSLIFGFISAGMYFLIVFFNTEDYGSWGNINSVSEVVNHFLRREYGTFNLQSSYTKGEAVWFGFFLKNFFSNSWSLLIVIPFILSSNLKLIKTYLPKIGIILFCLVAYFCMFYFGNVMPLDGFGETVFERFLMQPSLFIFFLALLLINIPTIELPKWLLMLVAINVGTNILMNYKDVNYRKNTVIEDYTINSLRSFPEKSIFFTFGDTLGMSTYYVHDVLGVRSDVIQIHPSYAYPWALKKLEAKYPGVFTNPENGIIESISLSKYSFFMNTPPVKLPEFYRVTNFGITYQVEKSKEARPAIVYKCDVAKNYTWRERSTLENLEKFESSHIYDLEYGRCYHAKFIDLMSKGETVEALKALENAVALSPLSVIYRERLCHRFKEIKDSRQEKCEKELGDLIASSNQQYYFYKYEN